MGDLFLHSFLRLMLRQPCVCPRPLLRKPCVSHGIRRLSLRTHFAFHGFRKPLPRKPCALHFFLRPLLRKSCVLHQSKGLGFGILSFVKLLKAFVSETMCSLYSGALVPETLCFIEFPAERPEALKSFPGASRESPGVPPGGGPQRPRVQNIQF